MQITTTITNKNRESYNVYLEFLFLKKRHSQLSVNLLHVAEFVAKATFSRPGGGLIGLSATV